MSNSQPRRKATYRRKRFALFASGAAVGSALGIVVGSLLTFWLGESTVRALRARLRRLSGDDSHPNFDLLLQ